MKNRKPKTLIVKTYKKNKCMLLNDSIQKLIQPFRINKGFSLQQVYKMQLNDIKFL
jgi:hypothetical protein